MKTKNAMKSLFFTMLSGIMIFTLAVNLFSEDKSVTNKKKLYMASIKAEGVL